MAANAGIIKLNNSVSLIRSYISKAYFENLSDRSCQVLQIQDIQRAKIGLRMIKINQLIINDELIESRLTTIYKTMHSMVNSFFMLIQGNNGKTSLYIGFHSSMPSVAEEALKKTLKGNFPGIICKSLTSQEISSVTENIQISSTQKSKTIAAISVVPSQRDEDQQAQDKLQANTQGIEKFMDTMNGKNFSAVIVATPYSNNTIKNKICSLEALYTSLSSFEKTSMQYTLSEADTITESAANTLSQTLTTGIMNAYTYGTTTGTSTQIGKGNGISVSPLGIGLNFFNQSSYGTMSGTMSSNTFGTNNSNSVGTSTMLGLAAAKSYTQSHAVSRTETNKEVTDLLEQLDRQIQRIKESEAHGLWDCCAYFISDTNDSSIVAANSFQGLMTGDNTNIEQSASVLWQPTSLTSQYDNRQNIKNILDSLAVGMPPVFSVNGRIQMTESIVTGKELSRMMDFPRKTAGDIAVIKMAAFGRSIHLIGGKNMDNFYKGSFSVGKIMHMGKEEPYSDSRIELQKLNAHLFAGGATGVGKTTSICNILGNLHNNNIPFTVIEPAKGEYGEIWGKMPDIEIYSTTPLRYRMLKINPFAFENNIHILDHMERLISVFSTAWPLYAAQPAILRDCVMMAYRKYGWDLKNSVCISEERAFPTFRDVLEQLPEAIKKSKFTGDSKGTYEGALQTRISMLTEGLFREILCSKYDIPNNELFDKNVIIDLSRIGSSETLSLTMGILLIRLYEHRIACGKKDLLKHVTVLEEAHNILKRVSDSSQGGEDGPSVGSKSVEVLTKCITELRFTGEGFIIADQSPDAIDSNAIKNTSTKVIMKLQDRKDQDISSASLALNQDQTEELSRLDKGIAVVYQEGWTEPVLTKFRDYKSPYKLDNTCPELKPEVPYSDVCEVRGYLLTEALRQIKTNTYDFKSFYTLLSRIRGFNQWKIRDYIALFKNKDNEFQNIKNNFASLEVKYQFWGSIIIEILGCEDIFELVPLPQHTEKMTMPYSEDPEFRKLCGIWKKKFYNALEHYCKPLSQEQKSDILKTILAAEGKKSGYKLTVRKAIFRSIQK